MVDLGNGNRPHSAEEAFALMIQLQESGQAVDFETWVSSFPEYAAELRELNDEWKKISADLAQAMAGPPGPDSPLLKVLQQGGAQAPAKAPPTLRPGARLGEFLLVRQIGQGGMGQVWEALQRSLGRVVALKLIRPDRIDAHSLVLFEREARAGGRVNDPRIVTVYATGETDGVRWIAEEYVAGEHTLSEQLARDRHGPARHGGDFERLARFIADVAEAMHAVHEEGVIHRDLKPGNILITADGRPKVTDFGLARLIDESSFSAGLGLAGTVHYMSPEQADGNVRAIGRQSDVFSLGTILYEALARRRPFEASSTAEILTRISRQDPPDPRVHASEVPPELALIALKALEKEPARRYASMAELAADLGRYVAREPIRARPPSALEKATKWVHRHPTATVAAGLSLVLALAIWGIQTVRGDLRAGQIRELITSALWHIDNGDLRHAEDIVGMIARIDPSNPVGHLILAAGHSRYGRFTEADAELAKAASMGFDLASLGQSREERFLRALQLIARREPSAWREAEVDLAQLTEGDPPLAHAWFPLYQVRKGLHDLEGAKRALIGHREYLRTGDKTLLPVVDALIEELDEDHEQAIALLLPLTSEPREVQTELRLSRHLGRNYLMSYLKGGRSDPALLDAAEASLGAAVEDFPKDSSSWAGLGHVQLLRASDPASRVERDWLRQRAEDHARKAQKDEPSNAMAAEVLLAVAFQRSDAYFDPARPDEALLAELERRLDAVERLTEDSEAARIVRSQLDYYRAAIALQNGDPGRAMELAESSIAADELQLYARVLLGGLLFVHVGDIPAAREQFMAAQGLWHSGIPALEARGQSAWQPRWGFAIEVWLFGTSDRTGDLKSARKACDGAQEWLDAGHPAVLDDLPNLAPDLLNLAEFLAMPEHFEFKDCERAMDLLERFGLQEHFGRLDHKDALDLIEKIQQACSE